MAIGIGVLDGGAVIGFTIFENFVYSRTAIGYISNGCVIVNYC